jgi:hypothetical protein
MTEAEWRACANARTMLTFLGDKPGERKLRLFACACWRQRWPELADPGGDRPVAAAERYADGRCPWEEVAAAHEEAQARLLMASRVLSEATWGTDRAAFRAAQDRKRAMWAAEWATARGYVFAATHILRLAQEGATKKQRAACAELAREVFGNPFRAVAVDPAWRAANDGLVARLAASIYDERRFGDLGVLADALEDVGCREGELLTHCRSPGPHVPGCWAVDLLLQKG